MVQTKGRWLLALCIATLCLELSTIIPTWPPFRTSSIGLREHVTYPLCPLFTTRLHLLQVLAKFPLELICPSADPEGDNTCTCEGIQCDEE